MGVQLINLGKRDAVVGIARNAEAGREAEEVDGDDDRRRGGRGQAATAGRPRATQPSAEEHEE